MTSQTKDAVIIGAGLTGLSLAYFLKKAGKNVLVIEKESEIGGVISTKTENGFTYETGPTTGVLGSLEIIQLFDELNSNCKLQIADKSANKRYIWKKNRWNALPTGIVSAISTPLFTLYDKIRILGEPFRRKGGYPDEPISEMVVRRLGKSFLNYAVDPFLSGVYAGDPEKLITRHALPKLYALEFEHGGFVRGTIAKHRNIDTNKLHSHKHKITREVFSVNKGLKNLILALESQIGAENILNTCQSATVEPILGGYKTTFNTSTGDQYKITSDKLVSTVSASQLGTLLPFVEAKKLNNISNTTYAPVVQIAVGFNQWTGIKLDAFGGLISSKDNRNILGILFPSAIFPNRAPHGGALLSVFMGGIKRPELLNFTDKELTDILLEELRITMKVSTTPDLIRIHRYQNAIAQYDIKTEQRLQTIAEIEIEYPGLIIAGSLRDGIGMSDRVKQAVNIAKTI